MRAMTADRFARGQRGLTLMIVLIALVSISLASVALIRAVDTGTLVLGNLGFKQATTAAADNATENATTWLMAKLAAAPTDLYESRCVSGCTAQDPTSAYYPTSLDGLDISGHSTAANRILVDWDNDNCAYAAAGSFVSCLKASPAATVNGYTTSYILIRMCKVNGDYNAVGNNCARPTNIALSSRQINKGGQDYGRHTVLRSSGGGSSLSALMFRIVARSRGPRNTVSYTETYLSVAESS
jgi:type IV pilus assembly protein PilX